MLKYILALTALLCLNACATNQKYTQKLNQEIGKTQQQLITSWGNPTQIKEDANGNKTLIYISKNQQILPINSFYYNNFMDEDEMFYDFTYGGNEIPDGNFLGETITEYCKTEFYIKNNIITSWNYKGNACVSL